jgi:ankyrin repeat protein
LEEVIVISSFVNYKTAFLLPVLSLIFGGWMDIETASAQRSRLLFEHPFIDAVRKGELQAVHEHIARGDTPDVRSINGKSPLMIAVALGDLDIVVAIILATDKLDAKDNYGNTALALAVIHNKPEISRALLDAGSSPNVQNRRGMTPLMLAAMEGRLIQVELMLKKNPQFTLRDYTGRSLMGWARESRDQRVLLLFEKLGLGD